MTDTIVSQPELIDEGGNITLNGREGLYLPLEFTDADGVHIDISASVLYFEIAGKLRKVLVAGPNNYTQVLVLTQTDVASLGTVPLRFVLRDETRVVDSVMIPDTLWEGKIRYRGYTSAPV